MPRTTTSSVNAHTFIQGVHGVRYQVKDVARSVAFYTQHLGFKVERVKFKSKIRTATHSNCLNQRASRQRAARTVITKKGWRP